MISRRVILICVLTFHFSILIKGEPNVASSQCGDMRQGFFNHYYCILQCFGEILHLSYIRGNLCEGGVELGSNSQEPVPLPVVGQVIECITIRCKSAVPPSVCGDFNGFVNNNGASQKSQLNPIDYQSNVHPYANDYHKIENNNNKDLKGGENTEQKSAEDTAAAESVASAKSVSSIHKKSNNYYDADFYYEDYQYDDDYYYDKNGSSDNGKEISDEKQLSAINSKKKSDEFTEKVENTKYKKSDDSDHDKDNFDDDHSKGDDDDKNHNINDALKTENNKKVKSEKSLKTGSDVTNSYTEEIIKQENKKELSEQKSVIATSNQESKTKESAIEKFDQDSMKKESIIDKFNTESGKEESIIEKSDQNLTKEKSVTQKSTKDSAKEYVKKSNEKLIKEASVVEKPKEDSTKEENVKKSNEELTKGESVIKKSNDKLTKEESTVQKSDQDSTKEKNVSEKSKEDATKENKDSIKEESIIKKSDQELTKEKSIDEKANVNLLKGENVEKSNEKSTKEDSVVQNSDQNSTKKEKNIEKSNEDSKKQESIIEKLDQDSIREENADKKANNYSKKDETVPEISKENSLKSTSDSSEQKNKQISSQVFSGENTKDIPAERTEGSSSAEAIQYPLQIEKSDEKSSTVSRNVSNNKDNESPRRENEENKKTSTFVADGGDSSSVPINKKEVSSGSNENASVDNQSNAKNPYPHHDTNIDKNLDQPNINLNYQPVANTEPKTFNKNDKYREPSMENIPFASSESGVGSKTNELSAPYVYDKNNYQFSNDQVPIGGNYPIPNNARSPNYPNNNAQIPFQPPVPSKQQYLLAQNPQYFNMPQHTFAMSQANAQAGPQNPPSNPPAYQNQFVPHLYGNMDYNIRGPPGNQYWKSLSIPNQGNNWNIQPQNSAQKAPSRFWNPNPQTQNQQVFPPNNAQFMNYGPPNLPVQHNVNTRVPSPQVYGQLPPWNVQPESAVISQSTPWNGNMPPRYQAPPWSGPVNNPPAVKNTVGMQTYQGQPLGSDKGLFFKKS